VLTPVERVLVLKGVDLLRSVGPRHLLALANVAREIELEPDQVIYTEEDRADALYIVVEGTVRLSTNGTTTSEVEPGEAFGTWALVDDSARGHRAVSAREGRALVVQRDDFYDLASGDLTLLTELVRVLAKRLRELAAAAPPGEARVEGEGVENPGAEAARDERAEAGAEGDTKPPHAGAALSAAALGRSAPPDSDSPAAEPVEPAEPPTLPVPESLAPPPDRERP
jgi:hypothetical protein